MTFPVTSKPTPPTVFNLQALDWIYCEEKTSVHTGISMLTFKWLFFFDIFKVAFAKKWQISKYSPKFINHYNWKKRYSSIRI